MMLKGCSGILGAVGMWAAASGVSAADVPVSRPELKTGDAWVFEESIEKGSSSYSSHRFDVAVQSLGEDAIELGVKADGSPMDYQIQSVGLDWSKTRMLDGISTVVARPFAFPLAPGEHWAFKYTDPTHQGKKISEEHEQKYKVLRWEDVTPPAGQYHALVIQCDTAIIAQIAGSTTATSQAYSQPGTALTLGGASSVPPHTIYARSVGTMYYVPSVKNYVKSTEDFFDANNVRIQHTVQTLVSFKPGA